MATLEEIRRARQLDMIRQARARDTAQNGGSYEGHQTFDPVAPRNGPLLGGGPEDQPFILQGPETAPAPPLGNDAVQIDGTYHPVGTTPEMAARVPPGMVYNPQTGQYIDIQGAVDNAPMSRGDAALMTFTQGGNLGGADELEVVGAQAEKAAAHHGQPQAENGQSRGAAMRRNQLRQHSVDRGHPPNSGHPEQQIQADCGWYGQAAQVPNVPRWHEVEAQASGQGQQATQQRHANAPTRIALGQGVAQPAAQQRPYSGGGAAQQAHDRACALQAHAVRAH